MRENVSNGPKCNHDESEDGVGKKGEPRARLMMSRNR